MALEGVGLKEYGAQGDTLGGLSFGPQQKVYGQRDPPDGAAIQASFLLQKVQPERRRFGDLFRWNSFKMPRSTSPASSEVATTSKQEPPTNKKVLSFGQQPQPQRGVSRGVSLNQGLARGRGTKEYGERAPELTRSPMHKDLEKVTGKTLSSSSSSSTSSTSTPADQEETMSSTMNSTSPSTSKEYGERIQQHTPMHEDLEKVTAAKFGTTPSPSAANNNNNPIIGSFLKSSPPKKEYGHQQRRGNEGWTQDKYLMTIKKSDPPTEKERKLQLEKIIQKELPSPTPPTPTQRVLPKQKNASSSPPSQLLRAPMSPQPKQKSSPREMFAATNRSIRSESHITSPAAAIAGTTPKEYGERPIPATNLQQMKFVAPVVEKQKSFRLNSILPKVLGGGTSISGEESFKLSV